MKALPPPLASRVLNQILRTRADPLGVLTTTARVVTHAQHVRIDRTRVETVAQLLALRRVPVPAWNYDYHFFDGSERSLTFILWLDALNFSFWGEPRWTINYRGATLDGYWALAAALKRAVERDPRVLDANALAEMPPAALANILRGENEMPMLVERWRNTQELGRVLRDHFEGSSARFVERAQGDAPALARLVAQSFSSFNDVTIYNGREVRFFKRAQILVADLWGSFGGKGWGEFRNLDQLTSFADYKLPQILRAWGMLAYDDALTRKIDRRRELPQDSAEEIEIRAAMLWAVELLREALARRGRALSSVQLDWFLWETSQRDARGMKPYHRVRTLFY
jgi:hypothetical protein